MMLIRSICLLGLVTAFTAAPALAQERFSFFLASTPESVERMLTLAGLRDDDVVVDLGSGDGLIPLTAARMNAKLRGWGVDINRKQRRNPLAWATASRSTIATPSTPTSVKPRSSRCGCFRI
jgi:methylase of polypeptide subunit release factors